VATGFPTMCKIKHNRRHVGGKPSIVIDTYDLRCQKARELILSRWASRRHRQSDDRLSSLENPRPEGAESSLTENARLHFSLSQQNHTHRNLRSLSRVVFSVDFSSARWTSRRVLATMSVGGVHHQQRTTQDKGYELDGTKRYGSFAAG
jgi:hypothetical protein